jgi:hypothetical protein
MRARRRSWLLPVAFLLASELRAARAHAAPPDRPPPAPAPAASAPAAPAPAASAPEEAPPAAAHPEPSAGDLATARNALKEGLALREKGDLVGALGRFTTVFDLVQTPVTGFELGKTHLRMGHVLQARELFLKIGRMPPALEESERSATAREEAARLAVDLEPRVPTLHIRLKLPEEASAVVRIDDDPITTTGEITARSVDPGKHVIVARAGDGPEMRVTVDVAEGETKSVDLAPQWVPPKEPAVAPNGGQVVYLRQTNPLVFVGFTSASVALTLTGVSAVLAFNAASRADDRCGDNFCPQYVRDGDVTEMRTWLAVSIVAGAATLAFVTVAVLSISRPTTEKVVARARPFFGPGGVGLGGVF